MDVNEEAARSKRDMIKNARETYLLMDSSKIGGIAYVTTCPAHCITKIVTDDGVAPALVKKIEEMGTEIILA